jgi:hypothetical protein
MGKWEMYKYPFLYYVNKWKIDLIDFPLDQRRNKMRRKIEHILVCMLVVTSTWTILFVPKDLNIKADSGGGGIGNNEGLDKSYIWNITKRLCNVTYDAYNKTDIPRGRSLGSKGGNYTLYQILQNQMIDKIGLQNVTKEQLQHIVNNPYNYSNIINVTDFNFTVYTHNGPSYPYANPIPKKEMFVMPSKNFHRAKRDRFWTTNFTFNNTTIVPAKMTKLWPFNGTYNNYYFRCNFNLLDNNDSWFYGNVTYVGPNETIPSSDDQENRVFLFEDVNSTQQKIQNITDGNGAIIIESGVGGIHHVNASNCTFPVVSIDQSSGNTVKNYLLYYIMFVDNVGFLGKKLTFTYNISTGWWPNHEFVLIDKIPNHLELQNATFIKDTLLWALNHWDNRKILFHPFQWKYWVKPNFQEYLICAEAKTYLLKFISLFRPNAPFKGVILYSEGDYHYMLALPRIAVPYITVNNTVGEFLDNYHQSTFLTGNIQQKYLKETVSQPGVIGYNIKGNLTIKKSPGDVIAIVSNRIDGMWGQTPGDSGIGGAVVLGIAKYFKDHPTIKPKYNLTFLFTTGEENGLLGAKYYNASHKHDKIKYWLIIEQLGFDQPDTTLCLYYSNTTYRKIIQTIINDSNYHNRTHYAILPQNQTAPGSEQGVTKGRETPCNSFCLVKDKNYQWDLWHRTGNNYTEGDCLNRTDRNDVNASAALAWSLIKYFMVNPDCRFNGSVTYKAVDSPNDTDHNNDSINATINVKTSVPYDKVRVKAFLIKSPTNETVLWKNFDFIATSAGTETTLTVTLPPYCTGAQKGNYSLRLRLYNSTGRINDIIDSSSSVYNDTNSQSGHVYLYPRGDTTANKPDNITGPSVTRVFELASFSTRTTDSNQDQLQYQWNWSLFDLDNVGPYNSGQQCNISHMFVTLGWQMIQVRARDDYGFLFDGGGLNRYGNWSTWSNPFYIHVKLFVNFDMSCSTLSSAQNALLSIQLPSILNLNSMYNGFAYGGSGQQTFSWTFDSSFSRQAKTTQYSYSTIGRHTVTLNVTDGSGFSNAISKNITVTNLSASYNLSTSSFYAVPGDTIVFNDTSAVSSGRHMINWTWSFNDGNVSYTRNTTHSYDSLGVYNVTLTVKDNRSENAVSHKFITIDYDYDPPQILYVTHSPDVVGMGCNVTIAAIVADNSSGVNHVDVNITYPDNTIEAYAMTHVINDTYGFIFNNTWQNGVYKYGIWTVDNANNTNSLNGFNFTVSSNATISISTLKDSYSTNQYINITDPPNPPQNLTVVDRGLTWNTYYNASTGCNILETYPGPVNYQAENGSWAPINDSLVMLSSNHPAYPYGYRMGNDRGSFGVYFKPDLSGAWPVAFTYNRSDNPMMYVVRSKLMGVGYVDPADNWLFQSLQNTQSSQAQTTGNTVTYPGVFTGTDVAWSYRGTELKEAITLSNTTKTLLQNHPPSSYGLHDASSYLVFVTKVDCQNLNVWNDSGMLSGNVTITEKGVEFRDALGQFRCALPLDDAYQVNDASVRQPLTLRIVHLNGETYVLSGLKVSDAVRMTFPIMIDPTLTVTSLSNDGFIWKSDRTYNTAWTYTSGTVDSTSTYLSIGQKLSSSVYYIYRGFVLFDTSSLPSNAYLDSAVLSLYKKDDFSTTDFLLTIQNGQPVCPHNPLQTTDYNKVLYSGNGGSLSTANFVNGRNNITLSNLAWINRIGLTKLCLRSSRDINGTAPTGNEYVNVYSTNAPLQSEVPKLIITYRNQSKIKNTGSTAVKGYLLIQVQYYNSIQGKWLVEDDTINETFARTINASQQLPLDTIFNGQVRTSDLKHNQSNYRVYAAFRDPDHAILRTNDGRELVAWWQFIGPQTG